MTSAKTALIVRANHQHQSDYQLSPPTVHDKSTTKYTRSVYARVPIENSLGDVSYTRFLVDCHMSRFFAIQKNWDTARKISETYAGRLIDFLIIRYSKHFRRQTTYRRLITSTSDKPNSNEKQQRYEFIHIYSKYETTLQIYGKQYMDIFRRGPKYFIASPSNPRHIWQTTIRQANMYRWLIENNVHIYLERHHNEIRSAMEYATKNNQSLNGYLPLLPSQTIRISSPQTPPTAIAVENDCEADVSIVPKETMTFYFSSPSASSPLSMKPSIT